MTIRPLKEVAFEKGSYDEERAFIEGGEYVIEKIAEALTPKDVSSYKELVDNVFNVIEELQRTDCK